MKGGYTIPGFFEDCDIVKNEVKERGFFGKVLFVIKKNELREPGFFGKTVLVFKKNGIYEPGFLGKKLFNVTKYGEVKELGLLGKSVGAIPVDLIGGGFEYIEEKIEQSETPLRHSTVSNTNNYQRNDDKPKKSLKEYKEELDVKSGFVADVISVKDTECVEVPSKYSSITAIAPALSINKLVIHENILSINRMDMLVTIKKEFEVHPNNPKYTSIKGVLYDKDVTRLLKVPADYDFNSLEIPPSVKAIGGKAFWGCSIESFDIPDSITSIGKEAFGLCKNMKHVYIPLTVTSVGSKPFWECKKLYIETAYQSLPDGWANDIQPGAKPIKWGIEK